MSVNIKPEGFSVAPDPWDVLFQAKEKGNVIDVQVTTLGFPDSIPTWEVSFADFNGIRGLVPESESGLPADIMSRFVGQEIRVKVKGLDKENNLVACSRQEAVADAAEKLLPKLAEDPETVWDGIVRAVLPPSAELGKPLRLLVDVGGGVLAEVPRREAAVWHTRPLGVQHPSGSRTKVKITKVEPDGTVIASIKKALPEPWDSADFKRGQFISGTVAFVRNSIVFVEPDARPGILGITSVPLVGTIDRGDKISCAVASFDRGQRKLRLRLRGRLT